MTPLVLALLACAGDPASGTAVGNPGKLDFTGTEVPTDVTYTAVELTVAAVELEPCDGAAIRTELDRDLDLLAVPTWPIDVDGGSYCSVVAELDGLVLVGTTDGGTSFEVSLAPDDLVVEQDFVVDGDDLLLAVPLAVDAAALEAIGEDVQIASGDEEAEAIAQEISSGVILGVDTDGDGQIDAAPAGLSSPGTDEAATSADSSAGCAAAGSRAHRGLGLLLVLLGLASRRDGRRRRPTVAPGEVV